jgi:hypothetical protein
MLEIRYTTRPKLERQTFVTSRLLEFTSRKELEAQTGHPVEQWPSVVLKGSFTLARQYWS